MLRTDGERFLPWMEDPQIAYEHLGRYAFASRLAAGKKILDLASGEGYGTALLAEVAREVTGVDISAEVVAHASAKYARDNLRYVQGAIAEVPIEGKHLFDVITCFEAIEHTEQHEEVMREVKRLLKPEGLLLISTPNKVLCANKNNPFHVKELYFEEFQALLGQSFRNLAFFGQKVVPVSSIFRLQGKAPCVNEDFIEKGEGSFRFVSTDSRKVLYFLAVASDCGDVEQAGDAYLVDVSEQLLKIGAACLEAAINGQEQARAELDRIYQSRGWKALCFYYRARDVLFPPRH
jgi:ubiquinone/menaquinone biosynthesis C-methylase UbiE